MAPKKRNPKAEAKPVLEAEGPSIAPFKKPPEVLNPFIRTLSQKHIYITHVDNKPTDFKRKIFLVPVAMNVATALLFLWRMYYILPYYLKIVMSGLGYPNDTDISVADSTWNQLAWEIGKRAFSFTLDLVLFVFVWPWPVEFLLGRTHGNPVRWRWNVGFRDKEIYVRRSREWDRQLGDILKHTESKDLVLSHVAQATAPMLQHEKTGYLTMNGVWDLDWQGMVDAHALVDKKEIAIEAFTSVVLVYHHEYGWMCLDMHLGGNSAEDEKRRQVFAFRDALTAVGKEDLFFRWIEIVQFEANQPGGFGPERQVEAAKKIRDLFEVEGIDFDKFWKECVGTPMY